MRLTKDRGHGWRNLLGKFAVHFSVAPKEEGRRKKEEGRRKKEEGRRKKEEGRRKKEEGRRKKEEGRRKKEEGRRKKEEAEGRRRNHALEESNGPENLVLVDRLEGKPKLDTKSDDQDKKESMWKKVAHWVLVVLFLLP